jgi:hypothetical protein
MAEGPPKFDPRGMLATLDRHRVTYIVIGAFARVIQGADEITRGVDIVPSTREENLRRLDAALQELGARSADGTTPALADEETLEPVAEFRTDRGELKVVPEPDGTRGYDDLRRAATREPLGQGLRPSVASVGDLSRMLSALGRDDDMPKLLAMRRLAELELSRGIEL